MIGQPPVTHTEKKAAVEPQEYPTTVYKLVPKPKPVKPEDETEETVFRIVNNEDEMKKAESDGYSKEIPKPKPPATEHDKPKK